MLNFLVGGAREDVVRIYRLIRYEWGGWWAHLCGKLSFRQRRLLRELARRTDLRLNLASGSTRFDGWTSVDASPAAHVQVDLRRRIPLPDGCAEYLFCEHFADHLAYPDAIRRFMRECKRLLKPGGRVRFVLHDAEGLAKAYLERDRRYFDLSEQGFEQPIETVNHLFRFSGFHQFLYDFDTFAKLLRECGFSDVIRCQYRQSAFPDLVKDFVHPSREVMSMYIEARA